MRHSATSRIECSTAQRLYAWVRVAQGSIQRLPGHRSGWPAGERVPWRFFRVPRLPSPHQPEVRKEEVLAQVDSSPKRDTTIGVLLASFSPSKGDVHFF